MNALTALEYPRILSAVAAEAATEEGMDQLLSTTPERDAATLEAQQTAVAWLLRRQEEGQQLPGGQVAAQAGLFDQVEREGAVLEAEDLRDIGAFLQYCESLHRFLHEQEQRPQILQPAMAPPAELTAELKRLVLPDGQLNEEAIPELRRLRSEIRRVNQNLLETAEQMIRRDPQLYQADRPTIRDGRTVVPLAANFRGRVDGIVHESSGSGETVYVEPRDLVDLNNSLVQARNGILQELRRVVRRLSQSVRTELPALRLLHRQAILIDTLVARARYGAGIRGRVADSGDRIELRQARHPLLGSSCVPLDISFDGGTRMLIVSGPNTGGKTVLLKTVGLLSLMHQSAIPVPVAAESCFPRFDYWGADIGDEQSIDQALSTFSGHLRNLAEVCEHAGPGSLILLDELGSGTDPEEGAALSMAVVDHLIDQGSTVLVTTHQTVLKHYGYTRSAAANASMAFDEATHRPTYRVVPGRPGASHALETAEHQGMPGTILRRAQSYLQDRSSSVAEIINRLGELEEQLSAERSSLAEERSRFEAQQTELQTREQELQVRETELRRHGLTEIDRFLREARRQVEGEVRRLRERGTDLERQDIKAAQDALRSIEDHRREQESRVQQGRSTTPSSAASPAVAVGMDVRHRRTERDGVVRSIKGSKAEVQFGAIRMTVPVEDLVLRRGGGERSGATITPVHHGGGGAPAALELDLRGQRLEPALQELERQIDAAILGGLSRFSVIHGTGTGVLQKGVRDYLEHRAEVRSYGFAAPEDGGFGKTVVELG